MSLPWPVQDAQLPSGLTRTGVLSVFETPDDFWLFCDSTTAPDGLNHRFIPSTPAMSGKLLAFVSGLKLSKNTNPVDYEEVSGVGIDIIQAPPNGSTVRFFLVKSNTVTTCPWVFDEIPTPVPNGTNRIFTLSRPVAFREWRTPALAAGVWSYTRVYKPFIQVYSQGLHEQAWTFTPPATITFTTAPLSGTLLEVTYLPEV